MIDGIGIDIVDIRRFKNAMERWGDKFTTRLFTEDELSYCLKKRSPETHLAARFAAKEAFIKAMSAHPAFTGYSFKEIEVKKMLNGTPHISVDWMRGLFKTYLSMSHEKNYCVAQVMVEKLN